MRAFRLVLGLVVLFGVTACNTVPVAEDLDQREANSIVALLNNSGINAQSERVGNRGSYSVQVRKGYYSQAVAILDLKGLPKKSEFQAIIEQRGILPNSREMDALKLDHASALELEELLHNHPGIATAKVVVRLQSLSEGKLPSASVMIQERPGQIVNKEEISDLVARAVPGIRREDISVLVQPYEEQLSISGKEGVSNEAGHIIRVPLVPFIFGWRVPDDDYDGLALTLIGFTCLVAFLGIGIGYWYGNFFKGRRSYETDLPELLPRSMKIDRQKRDLAEL